MAEGPRKSSRTVKIKKDPDFIYDTESNILLNRRETWHSSTGVTEDTSSKVSEEKNGKHKALNWSDLYKLPVSNHNLTDNNQLPSSESSVSSEGSGSLSQEHHPNTAQLVESDQFVDDFSEGMSPVGRLRFNSSTRLDFLESEDCFLSMSSAFHTDSSEMGNTDIAECSCGSGLRDTDCCSSAVKSKVVVGTSKGEAVNY